VGRILPSKGDEPKILRYYKRLFRLPSTRVVLVLHFLLGFAYGKLLFLEASMEPQTFLYGLTLLPLPALLADILTYFWFFKGTVLNLRRLSALSLFSNTIWAALVAIGRLGYIILGLKNLLASMQAFAFSATLCLRFVVFSALVFASTSSINAILSAAFHPLLSLIPLGALIALPPSFPAQVLMASIVFLLSTIFILRRVDGEGRRRLGVGSLRLFSSFVANWMDGKNQPLEEIFDNLGVERDVQVKLIAFGEDDRPFSILVIPYLHSGPFKNVGGSSLPSLLSDSLEASFDSGNTFVLFFHGPSGHEMNPTSRGQSLRVIEELRSQATFSFRQARVSRMVRASYGIGKALCQAFNDIALVILTLAPRTMEDLPSTIVSDINVHGKQLGFEEVFVVDAHNSTSGYQAPLAPEEVDCLRRAAFEALNLASKEERHSPKVGAFRLIPKEFSVSQGMGPGGISITVISVADQKVAYISVDGNNMVAGLREKILSRLIEDVEGIDDGEVTTTDTHVVNATIAGRGYHPVGEAIDQEALISYIIRGVEKALHNQRDALVAWKSLTIKGVKVLGKQTLNNFLEATDASISTLRRLSLLLYPPFTAILIAFFFFL